MKRRINKLTAIMLTLIMIITLAACGKDKATEEKSAAETTAETTVSDKQKEQATEHKAESAEADKQDAGDVLKKKETVTLKNVMEEPPTEFEVVIGYPKNSKIIVEEGVYESYTTLRNEREKYELEIYLSIDSTTYDDNQEYAKEEPMYEELNFSGFECYGYQFSDSTYEVNMYLDYYEYEDVYLTVDISSCSEDSDDWENFYELYQHPEVQDILNSVVYTPIGEGRPDPEESDGGFVFESSGDSDYADENEFEWWNGEWYGWWCIQEGTGTYEQFNDIAWDAYADITADSDGTGTITLWDTETSREQPLVVCDLMFGAGYGDHGSMMSDNGTFFETDSWLPNVIDVVPDPIETYEWSVDPADCTVSHFEDMLEIVGYYIDPDDYENSMKYYIYLRPWGTEWEDVRSGDTSGCLYSNMMPVLYDDWYVPLMDQGVEQMPSSMAEGNTIIGVN